MAEVVGATETTERLPFYRSLYFLVLVGIVLGIVLGHFQPATGAKMQPIATAFVNLIKMMIAPIIFCTVVAGIAGMESMKAVGRAGLYALIYFEAVTTLALIIGLVVINIVQPGAGMHVDPATLDTKAVEGFLQTAQKQNFVDFLLHLIPSTVGAAFASGDVLQVLVFAVLFGFALHATGERGRPVFEFIDRLGGVLFRVVSMIMYAAPLGAFAAMAGLIGKYGLGSLLSLGKLMACFYATCLAFVFVVLGAIARAHGFSIFRFVRYIRAELFIVLGTSSSESVLPRMMTKMEQAGCAPSIVKLVLPTGYSFNLDGTSIYLTMAAVFIAQATDTPFGLGAQIQLLIVLLLTSKGAAAVTGAGFVTLAGTLASTRVLPPSGVALIFGIDRFMSEARALTNLVGNGVATVVVAKWCGQLDDAQLQAQLAARPTDQLANRPTGQRVSP